MLIPIGVGFTGAAGLYLLNTYLKDPSRRMGKNELSFIWIWI